MKEDIIKWAREAGFTFCEESYKYQPNCLFYGGYAVDEQLKRFAALVAAAERNRLRSELNQIKWIGADVGWDLAVEAIQDWLQGEAKSEPVKNVADHSTDLRLPLAPGGSVGGVNQSSGMVQQKGES
jgi:hypothetical protein